MKEMISMCGLACHECPAFIATQADDDAKRAEVAAQWSKEYGAEIKTEDINCDGCVSTTGQLLSHCHVCEIRKCCSAKKLENCGYCPDYACEKLEMIFKVSTEAKDRLDVIHSNL